ncbi:MAG: trypsin-like peptidase domain-containing protein [Planctomycetes bacterium]|nr:trypsin-like peptidase domain-containing protein [Planctomycetota bacterium]
MKHGTSIRAGSIPSMRMVAVAVQFIMILCVSHVRAEESHAEGDAARELLRSAQSVFRNVADGMKPYLVRIETVGGAQPGRDIARSKPKGGKAPPPRRFRDTPGSDFVIADGPTTGVVYGADGLIVTSSFNFVREPILISVTLPDGRRLAADLVARDQVHKIALLKVDAKGLAVPEWTRIEDVRVGQWAVALGLGFGGKEPSVTVGIVSALNRMRGNAVQTDVKISPANYGGPLCGIDGRIIGLCVPMAQRPGELAGTDMYDSGVAFAVPGHRVRAIVEGLETGESVYRGWLGMVADPRHQDAVVVRAVAVPSPVGDVGIEPGDVIVAIGDGDIRHFGDLARALATVPAGAVLRVVWERDGDRSEALVTLARAEDLGPLPELEEPLDPSIPVPPPENP